MTAQAKVNLRLRVLAREAGSFHQIETLLLRLQLGDGVRVRRTDSARSLDVTSEVDTRALGAPERNLAWRAAEAYYAAAGWRGGFAIELVKRIPIGAGLGGGSADAGAVLRICEAMADVPLGAAMLFPIAASLGADVPFLASEHAYALGWGRGDRLLALPAPPARALMLVVPSFGVSTTAAYQWLDAERARGSDSAGDLRPLDLDGLDDWDTLRDLAVNDFESVVAGRHPEIASLRTTLAEIGASPVMLSGSGSCIFGLLPAQPAAASADDADLSFEARDRVGALGARVIVTRTATRVEPVSPLE